MKSLANILAFGALCALKGVAAAPTPYVEDPPVTVTITHTVTVVYPVTATTWVQPTDTSTVSTKGRKKGSTSTTTDKYPSTTTSSTTSKDTTTTTTSETESTESTTSYPTTSTTTTSSTTSTEETTLPPTPTPTPTPTTTTSSTTSKEPPPPPQVTVDVGPDNSHKSDKPDKSDKPNKDKGNSSGGGGSFSAIGTYYDAGLGSCGITSGPNDMIVAISHTLMDSVGVANPNNNPYCGKKVTCCREGGNPVTVTVVDRCVGCDVNHFDFSDGAYFALGGTIAEGVIPITCQWDS